MADETNAGKADPAAEAAGNVLFGFSTPKKIFKMYLGRDFEKSESSNQSNKTQ